MKRRMKYLACFLGALTTLIAWVLMILFLATVDVLFIPAMVAFIAGVEVLEWGTEQ